MNKPAKHFLRLRGDYQLSTEIGPIIAPHNAIFESFDCGEYKRLLRPEDMGGGAEYDKPVYFISEEMASNEDLFEEID